MKINILEILFGDAYEVAFGVRPAFNVAYLTDTELRERTEQIKAATDTYFR